MNWLNSFKKQKSGIIDLANAILGASFRCGHELRIVINEKFGEDSKEANRRRVESQYEFVYFFAHLAMRFAYIKLGAEKRNKLQDMLGPILAEATTEAMFGHWPQNLKEGLKNDFFNNINVAESEYSKYDKLVPEKNEGTSDTLFWEFSKNIAKISEDDNNLGAIIGYQMATIKEFAEMKLAELVDLAGKEI